MKTHKLITFFRHADWSTDEPVQTCFIVWKWLWKITNRKLLYNQEFDLHNVCFNFVNKFIEAVTNYSKLEPKLHLIKVPGWVCRLSTNSRWSKITCEKPTERILPKTVCYKGFKNCGRHINLSKSLT